MSSVGSDVHSLLGAESVAADDANGEAAGEGGGQARGELGRAAAVEGVEPEAPEDGGDDALHLHEGYLLAEAAPHAGLENGVLVGVLWREGSIRGEPPLRLEFHAVGSPGVLHPPHGVGVVGDPRTLLYERPVGEYVVVDGELGVELHRRVEPHALVQCRVEVVHVPEVVVAGDAIPIPGAHHAARLLHYGPIHRRVLGQEEEEAGEGGGDGVATRQEEADNDVAEVALVVDRGHEPGEEVLAGEETYLPPLPDDLLGEDVDQPDAPPKLLLGTEVEQPLEPPHAGGGSGGAAGGEARGPVEGDGELGDGEGELEAGGVQPEGDPAYAVEGEAAKDVLEVEGAVAGEGGQQGEQAVAHLAGDDLDGVGSHGDAPQFHESHLALEDPVFPVDVEDAPPEEVAEDGGEGPPLGVVLEAAAQHVLDVGRVGRDGVVEDVDVNSVGRGAAEQVLVPVAEVVVLGGPPGTRILVAHVTSAPWAPPPWPPLHQDRNPRGEQHHHGDEDGDEDQEGLSPPVAVAAVSSSSHLHSSSPRRRCASLSNFYQAGKTVSFFVSVCLQALSDSLSLWLSLSSCL